MLQYLESHKTGIDAGLSKAISTKAHYFYETLTDVVYVQTTSMYSPDASPLMPLVKPDGSYFTRQEWLDTKLANEISKLRIECEIV